MSTKNTEDAVVGKAPAIDYNLTEGKVTRTDKDGTLHVANFTEDGKLVLIEEHAKFRPAIVRFLNDNDLKITAVVLEGDENAKPKANIPPMPKKSMRLGDKTPEVVEWYRKYHPEEYKARYGIKGPGEVTKSRKVLDDKGRPVTELYKVDATISERKTHLTEKPEANDSGESEYKD